LKIIDDNPPELIESPVASIPSNWNRCVNRSNRFKFYEGERNRAMLNALWCASGIRISFFENIRLVFLMKVLLKLLEKGISNGLFLIMWSWCKNIWCTKSIRFMSREERIWRHLVFKQERRPTVSVLWFYYH
jgi:hypothetical protein